MVPAAKDLEFARSRDANSSGLVLVFWAPVAPGKEKGGHDNDPAHRQDVSAKSAPSNPEAPGHGEDIGAGSQSVEPRGIGELRLAVDRKDTAAGRSSR